MKKIMFNEIWKDIVDFEGIYQVSNLGNVRRSDTKMHKHPFLNIYGYYQVNLYKKNKHKLMRIHRLVAQAFIPNPNNYCCVNHKDENNLNYE